MRAIQIPNGSRFGRWTVTGSAEPRHGMKAFHCVCDCGTNRVVGSSSLRDGISKSCGCLANELAAKRMALRVTHSMANTPEYRTWVGIRTRCMNVHARDYAKYGARGITVCARWVDGFENFFSDMGTRPPGTSIDRINNDLGYSPENCRWATRVQQARNKRSNVILELDGIKVTMAEFAEKTGIPNYLVHQRYKKGLSGPEIREIYRGRYLEAP